MAANDDFWSGPAPLPSTGLVRAAGLLSVGGGRHSATPPGQGCQAEKRRRHPPAWAIIASSARATVHLEGGFDPGALGQLAEDGALNPLVEYVPVGDVTQHVGQRTNAETLRLTGLGSPARRGPSRDRRRRRPAATSRGDDFLANEVKSDETRELTLLEMAPDRVADHVVKGRDAVSLREDRLPEGSGRETPFRSFFDQEDYL